MSTAAPDKHVVVGGIAVNDLRIGLTERNRPGHRFVEGQPTHASSFSISGNTSRAAFLPMKTSRWL